MNWVASGAITLFAEHKVNLALRETSNRYYGVVKEDAPSVDTYIASISSNGSFNVKIPDIYSLSNARYSKYCGKIHFMIFRVKSNS